MEILRGMLPWIQVVLAVLLTISILLQQSDTSLGGAFGGDTGEGGVHRTRRGFEKVIFNTTIVFASLFVVSILLAVIL